MKKRTTSQRLTHKLLAILFVLAAAWSLQAQMPVASPTPMVGPPAPSPTPVASPTPTVWNPTAAGLNIIARPGQWSTSDGSPTDVACTAGETAVVDASGGTVCVIGTHGGIGEIQCMPPNGVFAGSGAQQLLCSVCYAGTPTTGSGEGSVAQCLAQMQGVPCENVIACTGSVSPLGNNGTCAVMECDGIWVNGCTPPVAIRPSSPGVCYTNATPQPPANPLPGAVTVGCFPGDIPSDIWRRCRNVYNTFVTGIGTTCSAEWANADFSSQGFQECQALVRSCIQQTRAACDAAARNAVQAVHHRLQIPAPLFREHQTSKPAPASQSAAEGELELR
jgi:hypothetical protein